MLTHLSEVLLKVKNPALFLSLCVRLLFETYWTVAAKASSPAKSSESRKSRLVHVFLVNVAFILLYVPVPGLRKHPSWLASPERSDKRRMNTQSVRLQNGYLP
jgi:hypothetical protein